MVQKKNTVDPVALTNAVETEDYREFIRAWMTIRSSRGRKFTFAEIARNGGFSSRGFPLDVASGRRSITEKSFQKFVKGLGLTGDMAEYFRLLVELGEPKLQSTIRSGSKIQQSLLKIRQRIILGASESTSKRSNTVFRTRHFPRIYAALGSKERGASLSDIVSRTRLPEGTVARLLHDLVNEQIVESRDSRFYPDVEHLSFQHLKQNEIFKNFYLDLNKQAKFQATQHYESESVLCFGSCFSVPKSNLPRLKEELRTVLLQFVDRSENSDGDSVASLVCSLF